MRTQKILVILLLAAAAIPPSAQAQLSPRGFLGAVTRPFRDMFGHFGHYPRIHRSHSSQDKLTTAASPEQSNNTAEPAAWPAAFDDILGYTFWPDDYAGKVRTHGFDVIAAEITGTAPRRAVQVATTGSAPGGTESPTAACDRKGNSEGAWLSGRIEQTVDLTGKQRDALAKLKAAVDQSVEAIKAGCQDTASLPPSGRLGAVIQQLWAIRDAGNNIRAPLDTFYDSLTDAQKARFEAKPQQKQQDPKADAEMKRQYQACAAPGMEASERLIKQIEQDVRPTQQQAASLDALQKASADMAKLLSASCGAPIPADPIARLDAAGDQLSSMSYAAASLRIALDRFGAQLDDKQKTKFDSTGR